MINNSFENTFIIKKDDTMPVLSAKLTTRGCMQEVIPYSLSGVSAITFSMSDQSSNLMISGKDAEIVDSDNGIIRYNWESGDTSIEGRYLGEFKLYFTGGKKLSLPRIGGINIQVIDDINNI